MGTQEKFEISWDLLDEVMLTHEDDTVVSSIGDAFVECMRNKAKVDIGYIAKLSGVSKAYLFLKHTIKNSRTLLCNFPFSMKIT